jgi:hypothetical protein
MAVNNSRNMRAEFEQGVVENTYMQLQPDWSLNANAPVDRLTWPTYQQAMRHGERVATEMLNPISPREPGPSMYSSRRGSGYTPGNASKMSLIEGLNAGGS